jgi:hypothetical protein
MNNLIFAPTSRFRLTAVALLLTLTTALSAAEKLRVLIVDGQNNHKVWPKSTVMMKHYLEATGLFTVDVARTKFIWSAEREAAFLPLAGAGESEMVKEPKTDPAYQPDFAKYAVVISNFGWKAADWPKATQLAFEKYVAGGGGFVSVHAADNSWGSWTEFNKMIAIGGWGDRTEKHGPYVYYNNEGKIVRDMTPGKAGKHSNSPPEIRFPFSYSGDSSRFPAGRSGGRSFAQSAPAPGASTAHSDILQSSWVPTIFRSTVFSNKPRAKAI